MNKEKCRKIYREAFMDEDETFENLLFDICGQHLKTLELSNETVSMLFLLPCVLKHGSETINTFYLYAAATDKKYRKKGYMERLIKNAQDECDLIFLRPASEKLCEYYKKLGFEKISANSHSDLSLNPIGCYKKLIDITKLDDKNEKFDVMYYSKNKIKMNNVIFNHSMN